MKRLAGLCEEYENRFGAYPPALRHEHRGQIYSTMDVEALSKADPSLRETQIEYLFRDPFAFERRDCNFVLRIIFPTPSFAMLPPPLWVKT